MFIFNGFDNTLWCKLCFFNVEHIHYYGSNETHARRRLQSVIWRKSCTETQLLLKMHKPFQCKYDMLGWCTVTHWTWGKKYKDDTVAAKWIHLKWFCFQKVLSLTRGCKVQSPAQSVRSRARKTSALHLKDPLISWNSSQLCRFGLMSRIHRDCKETDYWSAFIQYVFRPAHSCLPCQILNNSTTKTQSQKVRARVGDDHSRFAALLRSVRCALAPRA